MLHWPIYHDYLSVKSVFNVYVYGKDRRKGEGGGGKADILINMLSTPRCSNTVPKHKHKTPPHVPHNCTAT